MATMTTGVAQINAQIDFVEAVLVGGPDTIPTASRIRQVSPFDEKVKLPYYGGYEHFERVCSLVEDTSCLQVMFRWTTRTEVAE